MLQVLRVNGPSLGQISGSATDFYHFDRQIFPEKYIHLICDEK